MRREVWLFQISDEITQHAGFLAITRRAEAVFPFLCVIIRSCNELHYTHNVLLKEKTAFSSDIENRMDRPQIIAI